MFNNIVRLQRRNWNNECDRWIRYSTNTVRKTCPNMMDDGSVDMMKDRDRYYLPGAGVALHQL